MRIQIWMKIKNQKQLNSMAERKTLVIKDNGAFLNNRLSIPYNAYCKRKKISKYEKVDKYLLIKIAGNILKEIGKQMVISKGGVMIKNFGYFFVWKTQAKITYGEKFKHSPGEPRFNYHTNNYFYTPVFIPAGGPYNMKYWSMDHKFCKQVKDGICEKLVSGFKYRTYVYSLRRLLNLS